MRNVRKARRKGRGLIEKLFALARAYAKDPLLGKAAVARARKLMAKTRQRPTPEEKALFCRRCGAVLTCESSRTRVRNGKVIRYCKVCRTFRRIPYR